MKNKIPENVQRKINAALKGIEEANLRLEQAKREILSIEFYLEEKEQTQ